MPQFLVVGAGAALGAAARYLLSVALGGGMIPLLIINILGSALMGYFRPSPFWGTGVLGGFTTFSSYSLEAAQMIERRQIGLAAAYAIGSVVLAVGALFVGLAVARRAFGVSV